MKPLRLLAALLALLALACALRAETTQDPDKPDTAWNTHWIGLDKNPTPNSWTAYRHAFQLSAAPATATVKIAVDSKYWLWVNGTLVVFEGGLKRGPTPNDTYYDTIDIARWLHKGKNTVAVLAWFWGKNGFSHHDSGKAGLLFELTAGPIVVGSGSDWKVDALPAYGVPAGEKPNFRLSEGDIRFDARADIGDWQGTDFDDRAWAAARDLGAAGCPPWNQLYPRPIPFWKNSGLQPYANAASLPKISDGAPIVAKLPYNAQITPALTIDAPAGLVIGIRTGNYKTDGIPNVRAEYVTRAGVQSYESYGWMNGQEVIYTIPAGVKILGLAYRETGYDADLDGTFSCDDPLLDTLWKKAQRTLYITMRDNYMDCPDRERAQWWGDAVIEIGESFYSLSPSSALLARKAIRELCAWQRPDKALYAPVPAGNWDKELPQQMLAAVGQYGFWTYYLNTGDKPTALAAYPHVRDYLSLWKLDAQGLVVHRPGGWDWADWGDNIDVRVLDQAWYALALRGAENLARLANRPAAEVDAFEKTRRTVIAATNRICWNGEAYRSPGYKGDTDDRANALCVVAGIADAPRFPAIKKVLARSYHASPYMEKYVLEALMLMDDPDAAVARMKKRYGAIIADSWTTLPELWHGGTHNHAWSGGPLTILSQYFAGLAPLAPGWTSYQVRPQPGPLRAIDAKVDSAAGPISLSIRRAGQGIDLNLVSPGGTTAFVCLPFDPAHPPKRVTVNGSEVWPHHDASSSAPQFAGIEDGRLRFSAPGGTWAFHEEP